jgi:bifunctional DNase/RNase
MEDREMPRPNTHDLGVRMLRLFEGEVARVVVSDLRQGVYFAVMTVRNGDALVEIDARPSDAIAIALRVGAPIFVNPALFDPPALSPRNDDDGRQVRDRGPQRQVQIESI